VVQPGKKAGVVIKKSGEEERKLPSMVIRYLGPGEYRKNIFMGI